MMVMIITMTTIKGGASLKLCFTRAATFWDDVLKLPLFYMMQLCVTLQIIAGAVKLPRSGLPISKLQCKVAKLHTSQTHRGKIQSKLGWHCLKIYILECRVHIRLSVVKEKNPMFECSAQRSACGNGGHSDQMLPFNQIILQQLPAGWGGSVL